MKIGKHTHRNKLGSGVVYSTWKHPAKGKKKEKCKPAWSAIKQ